MHRERLNRIASYALSRWEAYAIVLLVFAAVAVAILGKWPEWVILASVGAGVVLLALLVLDSLVDPEAERDASMADIEVSRIRDGALRSKVVRAMEYVRAAQKLARRDRAGTLEAADDELPQLEQAVRSIYQMSLRLQEYRGERLLHQDLAGLQQRRAQRVALTSDQQEQLAALEKLQQLVREAEQGIDSALADLGRSYAEMQAMKFTPELRGRVADVFEQLEASTRRLSDLAEGYDEVFGSRRPSTETGHRG